MTDKQITVFIAIKQRPNFSIINSSFNLCCSLKAIKPNEFFKFRKSIKVANYLTLNVDMIKVLVLAKSQKPGFSPNIIIKFAKNIKAEMTIFIAQPLFLESGSTRSEMRDFFRIDVSSKSFNLVLFELKLQV